MDCNKYLKKLNLFKHNYVGFDKEKNKLWCMYLNEKNGTSLKFLNSNSNELKINDDIIVSKDLFVDYCNWYWLFDIYLSYNDIFIFVDSDKFILNDFLDKKYYLDLVISHLCNYLELYYFYSYNKNDNKINNVESMEYLRDKFNNIVIVD